MPQPQLKLKASYLHQILFHILYRSASEKGGGYVDFGEGRGYLFIKPCSISSGEGRAFFKSSGSCSRATSYSEIPIGRLSQIREIELRNLDLDHAISMQRDNVEEQVDELLLSSGNKAILLADIREALPQLFSRDFLAKNRPVLASPFTLSMMHM